MDISSLGGLPGWIQSIQHQTSQQSDTDSRGGVSFQEIQSSIGAGPQGAIQNLEALKERFNALDTNSDGELTQTEMKEARGPAIDMLSGDFADVMEMMQSLSRVVSGSQGYASYAQGARSAASAEGSSLDMALKFLSQGDSEDKPTLV